MNGILLSSILLFSYVSLPLQQQPPPQPPTEPEKAQKKEENRNESADSGDSRLFTNEREGSAAVASGTTFRKKNKK